MQSAMISLGKFISVLTFYRFAHFIKISMALFVFYQHPQVCYLSLLGILIMIMIMKIVFAIVDYLDDTIG